MGRQVRFMLDDDAISLLDQHLREVGAVSVPMRADSPDLDAHQGIPQTDASWFSDIIRSADIRNARRTFQPTPWAVPPSEGYWRFDAETLPTVDYMRGSPIDPQQPGRLHFATTRLETGRSFPLTRRSLPGHPSCFGGSAPLFDTTRRPSCIAVPLKTLARSVPNKRAGW